MSEVKSENRNEVLAKEIAESLAQSQGLSSEESAMIQKILGSLNPKGQSWDSITDRIAQRILKEEQK